MVVGAKEAVKYLIEKGHRQIAHLRGPREHRHAEEMSSLYRHFRILVFPLKEYVVEGNFAG